MTSPQIFAPPVQGVVEAEIRLSAAHFFDAADLQAISLDDRQRTGGVGLMLIAHATIEFRIEDACRRTADRITAFQSPVTAFLAWGMSEGKGTGPTASEFEKQRKVKGSLQRLRSVYEETLRLNNGVKQKSLEQLLIPLGIDLKALTAALSTLETFGHRRGELAHNPPALAASLQSSPSAILSEVIAAAKAADEIVISLDNQLPTTVIPPPGRVSWLARIFG